MPKLNLADALILTIMVVFALAFAATVETIAFGDVHIDAFISSFGK
jgi:hypothetical protein